MFRIAFCVFAVSFCLFAVNTAIASDECEMDPELCQMEKDSGVYAPVPDSGSGSGGGGSVFEGPGKWWNAWWDEAERGQKCNNPVNANLPECKAVVTPPPSGGGSTVTPPPTTGGPSQKIFWWVHWLMFILFTGLGVFLIPQAEGGGISWAEKIGGPIVGGVLTKLGLGLIMYFTDLQDQDWFTLVAALGTIALLPPRFGAEDSWVRGVEVVVGLILLGIALYISW